MDGGTETGLTRTPAVSDTSRSPLVSGQRPFSSSGRTITADHLDSGPHLTRQRRETAAVSKVKKGFWVSWEALRLGPRRSLSVLQPVEPT